MEGTKTQKFLSIDYFRTYKDFFIKFEKIRWEMSTLFQDIQINFYAYKYISFCSYRHMFANGQGDLGSIPHRLIPMTQKIVLDA